jgi:hypothetical protein
VTIDPALSERLRVVLRHRAETRREALTRLHETFADELGPLPDETPVELGDLSAEELARLTVDVLWPPTQEEYVARARELMARAYEEVVGQKQNPEGA